MKKLNIAISEKVKTLLICAAGIYGVILASAIIVYFMMPYVVPEGTLPTVAETQATKEKEVAVTTKEKTTAEILKDLPKEEPKGKSAEEKEKEEKERQAAKERAEKNSERVKKQTAAAWGNDRNFRELQKGMKETVRGNVTFYTHNYSNKPPSGVYIRPFVLKGKDNAILKNDIYYFVAVDDANFGWVHGDTVNITADGTTIVWSFDPQKRRDKLSKSAEEISENYVETASDACIADLKTIGNATNVSVYYYNHETGSSRSSPMSRENVRHIRDMVKLYELFNGTGAENNG